MRLRAELIPRRSFLGQGVILMPLRADLIRRRSFFGQSLGREYLGGEKREWYSPKTVQIEFLVLCANAKRNDFVRFRSKDFLR